MTATPDDVLAIFFHVGSYDPESGKFTWLCPPCSRLKPGDPMGSIVTKGYRRLQLGGTTYAAHRIAWLVVHGRWPTHQIDHINGIPDDNRIINLREATNAQNIMNTRRRSDNISGHRGVSWHRAMKKWVARIAVDKKIIWLGAFRRKDDAISAYLLAGTQHYGKFFRHE